MNKRIAIKGILMAIVMAVGLNSMMYGQELIVKKINPDSTQMILKKIEKGLPIGKIKIKQDRRVDSLLRKHIGYNDSVGIQGWKILIYHGRDVKKAQDAGALFTSAFPKLDLSSVVDYKAPDFKTLVGAFRTREEAYRLHQQIKSKKEFEFSYLVQSTFKAGELK